MDKKDIYARIGEIDITLELLQNERNRLKSQLGGILAIEKPISKNLNKEETSKEDDGKDNK